MNVTYISSYLPQPCGIATYSHDLIQSVSRLDDPPTMTVLAEGPATSCAHWRVRSVFRFDEDYVERLTREVVCLAPTVAHIQHEYGLFGMDERFLRLLTNLRRLGIPTVVTLHTVHTRHSIDLGCASWRGRAPMKDIDIEWYQLQIGELAERVIVHQEESIRQVLLRQGLSDDRVVTIPHGTLVHDRRLATTSHCEAKRSVASPRLVAFGYLEPSKNHLALIEAVYLLHKRTPNATAILGGFNRTDNSETLEYRARCEEKIRDLKLEESVRLLDAPVPEEDVASFLMTADVACFLYDEDTRSSSGALHRALGCGCAVVTSRIPKFHELVGVMDEILVNPRLPAEIAHVLERVLCDRAFRHSVECNVRRYARQTAWPLIAAKHVALYRDMVHASSTATNSGRLSSVPRASWHAGTFDAGRMSAGSDP